MNKKLILLEIDKKGYTFRFQLHENLKGQNNDANPN